MARTAAPREGGQKGSHVHCGYQRAHVMPTCASFSCWTSCDRQWPWALCGSEVSQELSYVPNILAYSVTGLDPCLHRACWGQWDQEEARPCSGHRGPWNKRCTHLGPYFSICACVVLTEWPNPGLLAQAGLSLLLPSLMFLLVEMLDRPPHSLCHFRASQPRLSTSCSRAVSKGFTLHPTAHNSPVQPANCPISVCS